MVSYHDRFRNIIIHIKREIHTRKEMNPIQSHIVLDDKLTDRAQGLTGIKTKREAEMKEERR